MLRINYNIDPDTTPMPAKWPVLTPNECDLMTDHDIDYDDFKARLAAVANSGTAHTQTDEKRLCHHAHMLLNALKRERRSHNITKKELAYMTASNGAARKELRNKTTELTGLQAMVDQQRRLSGSRQPV